MRAEGAQCTAAARGSQRARGFCASWGSNCSVLGDFRNNVDQRARGDGGAGARLGEEEVGKMRTKVGSLRNPLDSYHMAREDIYHQSKLGIVSVLVLFQ